MNVTTLTPAERLQIVNQFRILEKLDPDNANRYAEHREIIAHGFTIQYGMVFQEIYQEMPASNGHYVYDIRDLFTRLKESYEALEDKQGLLPENINFDGFDGNHESQHLAFVEHLLAHGHWPKLPVHDSHGNTAIKYHRMLGNYAPIKEQESIPWLLTADQIKQIISWQD